MSKDTWSLEDPALATDPEVAARYALGREVGRGGMGRVLVAHDAILDRDVACKLLDRPAGAARFAREARLTARLDHPGIVPVYDAGELPDGTAFYTMRLLDGVTLTRRLAEPGDRLRHVDALVGATRAVAHAHQHGVVHRDLKPDNLVVGPLGDVQVVDWGIAVEPATEPTPARAGTPPYMSPEQAAGGAVTAAVDVFALGLILWEILAGRPHRPAADSLEEALAVAIRAEPPPPVGPPELDAIVRRATRRDPADRYPDAAALLDDLLAWRDGRRVSAHRYSPREELRRVVSAYRWPLGLVATAATVGLGVGTVAYAQVLAQRDAAESAQRATASVNRRLMLERAVQAAQDDDVPSALAWSAAVLDEAMDPGALGLQLRLRGQAPLAPGEILPGTADCVALHQDDQGLLCLTTDALRTGAWTAPASGAYLTIAHGMVAVWGAGSVTLFARTDGRELGSFEGRSPFFADDGRIGWGSGREIVIARAPDDPAPERFLTSSLVGGGWFTPDGTAHTWHADGTTSSVGTDGGLTLEGGLSTSGVWTGAWSQGRFVYVDQVGLLRTHDGDAGASEGTAVGRAAVYAFGAGFVTVSRDLISSWDGSTRRPRWTVPTLEANWIVANGRIYARTPGADWQEWTARSGRAHLGPYANGTRCATPPSGALVCAVGDRLVHANRDGTIREVPLGARAAAPVISTSRVYGVANDVNVMDFEGAVVGVAAFAAAPQDLRGHVEGAWLRTATGELWFIDEQARATQIPAPPFDQIESGGRFVVGRTGDGTVLWLDRSGATLASTSVGDARLVAVEAATGRVATWDGATGGLLDLGAPPRPLACRPYAWVARDVLYCNDGAWPELVGLNGDRIPLLGTSSTIGGLTPEVRPDGTPTGWVAVVYGDGTIGWMDLGILRGSRSWTDDVRAETGFEVRDGALRFAPR